MKRNAILTLLLILTMLLGIHDGYLALWQGEDPQPVEIYPCRAELLPPADRAALQKGIPIRDEAQLRRLLEDLWS